MHFGKIASRPAHVLEGIGRVFRASPNSSLFLVEDPLRDFLQRA
jgi:hypothetical protein